MKKKQNEFAAPFLMSDRIKIIPTEPKRESEADFEARKKYLADSVKGATKHSIPLNIQEQPIEARVKLKCKQIKGTDQWEFTLIMTTSRSLSWEELQIGMHQAIDEISKA